MHRRPEFIPVLRSALRHPELAIRDALALGLIGYRARIGSRIGASEIAEVFGWDRTTGWRAVTRLRELRLIDAEGLPVEGALPEAGGFLKVRVEHVRELGELEAVVLAQLPSLPALRMVKMRGRHMQLAASQLAALIGCCVDTVLAVLKRLSTGLTNRVNRALRKGEEVLARARIELVRVVGFASRVRLLGERELKPVAPAPVATPAPAVVAPSTAYVPTMEELAAMMSAGAARQRS